MLLPSAFYPHAECIAKHLPHLRSSQVRGLAIPVAWCLKPGGQPGPWMPDLCHLLDRLGPAVPSDMTVRVLCDRGLQSPDLWAAIRRQGWHPYMRYDRHMTFQATTGPRWPAWRFVARAGQYTVTTGKAFRERKRACTLIVLWAPGQETPWVLLTDEAPEAVDLGAYGLRVWIEQGLRTLKRMGWQWHRTRRVDPVRVDRHGLVLAVATLNLLAAAGSARNRAALDLLYYAGLRVGEVCGLQVRDIAARPEGGCVLAVHGQGGRTRHIALPAAPAKRLSALVENRDPDSPAIRTASGRAMTPHGVRQVVAAAARRAGLEISPSPHWLRHACASHSLDRGAPVHVVQQTLGHASLATTSRYTHARPGQSAGAFLAE